MKRSAPLDRSAPAQRSKVVQRVEHGEGPHGAAVTYQLELVLCGKERCRCARSWNSAHGPYWYAYWKRNGRKRRRYIGKRFRSVLELEHVRQDSSPPPPSV